MAQLDSTAGEIVIRLVYDGPPEAGKTTSLRALAGSLTRPTYSPAEDADGRTLWFDWMEYVGGRYEGCQIRCQIVSVAGQRELAARRRRVIAGADVVVFVADSALAEVPRTLAYLQELRGMLDGAASAAGASSDVPVGVILQANKRDLPGAVPLDELRGQLAEIGWPIGVVESIAAEGTGIREAFVYAVRLALDRVRELVQRGALPTAPSGPSTAEELLAALHADDDARNTAPAAPAVRVHDPDSLAAELFREVLACEHAPASAADPAGPAGAPRPPTTSVPSGAIWPPVEGRAILHELAELALAPRRLSTGDWAAGLGTGWRVMSSRDAVFDSLDHGRSELIQWARLHAGASASLSRHRCIVLADDGHGGWRLWQLVHAEPSLRDAVDRALREPARDTLIAGLRRAAQLLVEADAQLAALAIRLPCTLDNLGVSDTGVVYIGLMPDAAAVSLEPRPRRDTRHILRAGLEPVIARDLRERGLDLDGILGRLQPTEGIAHAITSLLGA
ncbi:MAG TPA: GTPase domain-containing protein [Kofleriaceae bacterium]|jgi:GTPase SAR1 family protein|nr:GTPase domain-containing protein [Kofleriaceae bacterium]